MPQNLVGAGRRSAGLQKLRRSVVAAIPQKGALVRWSAERPTSATEAIHPYLLSRHLDQGDRARGRRGWDEHRHLHTTSGSSQNIFDRKLLRVTTQRTGVHKLSAANRLLGRRLRLERIGKNSARPWDIDWEKAPGGTRITMTRSNAHLAALCDARRAAMCVRGSVIYGATELVIAYRNIQQGSQHGVQFTLLSGNVAGCVIQQRDCDMLIETSTGLIAGGVQGWILDPEGVDDEG